MPTANLVVTGARIRTLDPRCPYATAVAVRDGLIAAATGAVPTPRSSIWEAPIWCRGWSTGTATPVWGLEMATGIDLSEVTDLDGLRAALVTAARTDGWVVGYGLDHNVFGGRPVDRALVEDVLAGAPAFLRHYDGHSALVTGAALVAAGVTGPLVRPALAPGDRRAGGSPAIRWSTRRWTSSPPSCPAPRPGARSAAAAALRPLVTPGQMPHVGADQ